MDSDHRFGADCWCNPYVVEAHTRLVWTEPDATIVRIDRLDGRMAALHIMRAASSAAAEGGQG